MLAKTRPASESHAIFGECFRSVAPIADRAAQIVVSPAANDVARESLKSGYPAAPVEYAAHFSPPGRATRGFLGQKPSAAVWREV
jgi:hypothetical protein